jgi:hypothetical protein
MRNFLQFIAAILSITILFSSCSQTTSTVSPIPTSMKLSVDKNSVIADGIDKITVTVQDQSGNDISTSSAIYTLLSSATVANFVSGNGISFEANQQGTYKVFATKYGVISDTLTITTTNPGVAKYSSKVLAEEFTGAWAGWCPRVTYKTDKFMLNNSKLFTVRIHNGDVLSNRIIDSTLRLKYTINAVPNVLLNRTGFLNENGDITSLADSTELRPYLQKRAVLGLALNTSISGNTLNVTSKVGFDATISDSLKLVVLVVENGLVLAQTNYYNNNTFYPGSPYLNSGNPITGYIHNQVVRVSPTTTLGTTITAANQVKNGEYSTNFAIDITGYNSSKLQVVAFVTYADAQVKYGVLNAQWVQAGSNKSYD